MGSFTLFDATEFRKRLQEEYGVYTHFHDQCGGGLSFSYDEPLSDEMKSYVENYFETRGIQVRISGDGRSFIMIEK